MTEGQPDRPRPARVAAIDPGSVKAGMVVLEIQPAPAGFIVPDPGAVGVLASRTVRKLRVERVLPSDENNFANRMAYLFGSISSWAEKIQQDYNPELWCVEDPRDITPGKQLRGRGAIVTLGAAFGVACVAFNIFAYRSEVDVTLVPALEWIPKTRTRNLIHPMKHKAARAWLRARWPALASLTDDEVFASGVAIWAHTKGAMAAIYPI